MIRDIKRGDKVAIFSGGEFIGELTIKDIALTTKIGCLTRCDFIFEEDYVETPPAIFEAEGILTLKIL